ncbi:spermatogenesis-associated protein 7 homolog [Strongylocentrotus purpuratus]|uniref:Spermatogenesis-associated protein 7 n=1 Tax=Strongylocentrotus purpuratus TaxID=7668 RepID=A0A7M7HMH6_STRPU|nr:spermatogenesis-associated protein 7 homolog [Strongylocentrotus purpuratus]
MAKPDFPRATPTPAIPPRPVSVKGFDKGQLSLKSSPYSSNNKCVLNQNDVINGLNVHYKKLGSAKSRIDSSLPKSWTSSTIKKDQLKRQAMDKQRKKLQGQKKTSSRPASRNTTAMNDPDLDLDEDLTKYGISEQRGPRHASMTPQPYRPHSAYSDANRPRTSQSHLYNTSNQYRNTKNNDMQGTMTLEYQSRTPRKESADILDKRADKFTESRKLFTPRTLKTTATSRLSQSKNYNAPKRKGSTKGPNDTGRSEREQQWDENNTRTLHSREQLEELEERDRRENARHQRAEDHLRWVEEQAMRVQTLELNDGEEDELRPMSSSLKPSRKGTRPPLGGTKDLNVSYGNQSLRSELASMTYRTPDQVSKRMQEEEEELRYLEFVTDVTNDVLNRGIFTNTVLKQVFESHIDKNKGRLDEGRMRHLMTQLKEDLAIPSADSTGDGT